MSRYHLLDCYCRSLKIWRENPARNPDFGFRMGAMAARIRGERRRKEAPDTMISKIYAFIQHAREYFLWLCVFSGVG
eukprot:1317125-Amorphochlora_amoeboformis.AAC.2